MTALETLRAMKRATAAEVAEQSGIALELVYLDLVAAESSGLVALRHDGYTGRKKRFLWVAL